MIGLSRLLSALRADEKIEIRHGGSLGTYIGTAEDVPYGLARLPVLAVDQHEGKLCITVGEINGKIT